MAPGGGVPYLHEVYRDTKSFRCVQHVIKNKHVIYITFSLFARMLNTYSLELSNTIYKTYKIYKNYKLQIYKINNIV